MPRLRFAGESLGISLGGGVSVGAFESPRIGWYLLVPVPAGADHWDAVVWFNTDIGIEGRTAGGLLLRPFIGVAKSLASIGYECRDCGVSAPTAPGELVPVLPYFGLTIALPVS